jgi:hypothetical protein
MLAATPALAQSSRSVFPLAEVQAQLRRELEQAEAESGLLHPGWQPVLDSLRMVAAIATIERLLNLKLPPERVVKKSGHKSVDEGVEYMTPKIREEWTKRQE